MINRADKHGLKIVEVADYLLDLTKLITYYGPEQMSSTHAESLF